LRLRLIRGYGVRCTASGTCCSACPEAAGMRGAQAPRPSPGLPCVVCFAIFLHVCVPTGCWAALLLSAGGRGRLYTMLHLPAAMRVRPELVVHWSA